jgi:hypothetical protein
VSIDAVGDVAEITERVLHALHAADASGRSRILAMTPRLEAGDVVDEVGG